jgi:IS66 C-terminal element
MGSHPGQLIARFATGLAPGGRIVEQVRRHGADPFAYFEWVFEKLMHNPPADQLGELLPINWIKTRPAALQTIDSCIA